MGLVEVRVRGSDYASDMALPSHGPTLTLSPQQSNDDFTPSHQALGGVLRGAVLEPLTSPHVTLLYLGGAAPSGEEVYS